MEQIMMAIAASEATRIFAFIFKMISPVERPPNPRNILPAAYLGSATTSLLKG